MDQERYVEEPNQVLHPGEYRRERYNDTNGAVYETTHYGAHGNAFTQNQQLGSAERYGYNYVGGDAPPALTPSRGLSALPGLLRRCGAVGGVAAYYEIADNHVLGSMSGEGGEEGGEFILLMLVVVAVLTWGPLCLGVWMVRRAAAAGRSLTHGRFVLLLEVPWLAVLWGLAVRRRRGGLDRGRGHRGCGRCLLRADAAGRGALAP
ncbi:hypothetical protein ACFYTG_32310 [Streptomyces mirabilis]|uniref:hypothetical protein n=1 Tax=Streptomyces mirabilis TaxID=68239 RepID=UPI00369BD66B